MLHPSVVVEILDAEIAVSRERLGDRVGSIRRNCAVVLVDFGENTVARLDGTRYDAEPYSVSFQDAVGQPLAGHEWPAGINAGPHPIFNRPFICIRGTAEYHTHPSHLRDRWDFYRGRIALADLLDHICNRLGR